MAILIPTMIKKGKLFPLMLLLLIFGCRVNTLHDYDSEYKGVEVIGYGYTEEDALRVAFRRAVEMAAVPYVYSEQERSKYIVSKSKIIDASKGYVYDYKIKDRNNKDGLIILNVDVVVNYNAIKSVILNDTRLKSYDDALKEYSLVTFQQERLRKRTELLKYLSAKPIDQMYSTSFAGYDIKNVTANNVRATLYVKMNINPFFWDSYYDALSQLESNASSYTDVFCIKHKKPLWSNSNSDFDGYLYLVHGDISDYIIKPRSARILLSTSSSSYESKFYIFERMVSQYDPMTYWVKPTGSDNRGYSCKKSAAYMYIGNYGLLISMDVSLADASELKSLYDAKVVLEGW